MKKALDRNRLPFQGMNKKNLQELKLTLVALREYL